MQFNHRILANNIKYFRVKAGLSQDELGKKVQTGEFGAEMQVALVNDGPVTICMDSKRKE